MIRSNLRLVVKIAHDYANLGLPLLDLISEGNIGLMKAVERFDPAKGGKLSTYAAWWIKQSIKRALANQSKTIRLPVHLVDKISKMRRVSLQMSEELGREPTDEELGDEIGIASGKVSPLKTVSIRPASLDAPISDDDSTEFGEIVGDEDAQTPFELLRDKNLRNEVGGLLDVLDEREKKIIFQRFGLDGGKPKTLEEVGKKFGVTRERIRQLQNTALWPKRNARKTSNCRSKHKTPPPGSNFKLSRRADGQTSARFVFPASSRCAALSPIAPLYWTMRSCTESIMSRPIVTSPMMTIRSPAAASLFLRKIFSAAAMVSSARVNWIWMGKIPQ